MGAIAVFNYVAWAERYPEFSAVSETLATAYFAEASIYHANDGSGPVCDPNVQLTLLNMLTAHIAARYATVDGEAASTLVGRISNASEGSVSVGTTLDVPPGSAQWFAQSKYGYDYWAATAVYRTMRYIPGRCRTFGSFPANRFYN